jgi:hypothetical protein
MRKTNTRNILIKVIAISLPVLLVIGMAEIALRFYGPEYYKSSNDSSEYYSNPRDYHIPIRKEGKYIIYGLHYIESRERYRLPDDELSQPDTKGKGVPGILAIGDSFTYGRGVKYEDIYTTRLFRMLSDNGYRPYVINCGKAGAQIEEIAKIHSSEISRKKYPVVVYGFVPKDFGKTLKTITASDFIDNNNGLARLQAYRSIRNISKIVNLVMFCIEKYTLHTRTTKAYLDAFKDKNAQKKFELIADINRKTKLSGGKLVIMVFPLLYDFDNYPFREIHEKIASFCAKEEIPMLDLLPAYSLYRDKDLWVNPTDQHPNEIAHKIAAERLYDFLVEQKLVTR